jgi:hypothetical protein
MLIVVGVGIMMICGRGEDVDRGGRGDDDDLWAWGRC